MSKNEWKKWIGGMGRMLLAFALIFAQTAVAGQNETNKGKAEAPRKAATQPVAQKQSAVPSTAKAQTEESQQEPSGQTMGEQKTSRDGAREGIKIHGHWTIEVRNPDRSLVRHVEFQNSLLPSGGPVLPAILSRGAVAGGWTINLNQTGLGQGAGGLCRPGNAVSTCPRLVAVHAYTNSAATS